MSNEIGVYDPDPTDLQMRAWGNISLEGQEASDLANPVIVTLLVEQRRVHLAQIKVSQTEVTSLRSETNRLRDENEKLKIQVAKLEIQSNVSLLQIAIGLLSGFAINMITSNATNILGWFLLIMSIVMLFLLRGTSLPQLSLHKQSKQGDTNE